MKGIFFLKTWFEPMGKEAVAIGFDNGERHGGGDFFIARFT
jgi:hypothetical protein